MSLLHRILPFSPTRHFNEPVQTPRAQASTDMPTTKMWGSCDQ